MGYTRQARVKPARSALVGHQRWKLESVKRGTRLGEPIERATSEEA